MLGEKSYLASYAAPLIGCSLRQGEWEEAGDEDDGGGDGEAHFGNVD